MKKNAENPMATATGLLAERRKYEGWLAALNERRSTTPDHVFTRVHADYEARLGAVIDALTSKAAAFDARVAELTARTGKLQDEARAVDDERTEAELRAHVGELESDAWNEAARAADARLKALEDERRTVDEELATIRQMVYAARSPTPEQHDAFAQPAQADGARPEDAAGGDAPIVTQPAAPRATGGFDELAFLRDVAGANAANPPSTPGPAAAPPASLEVPPPPDAAAEPVPPGAAGAETPDIPDAERPINDSLGLVLPDERPAITPPRRPSTETPMAANITGNLPIVLHNEGKQAKTLKCTDCGSMNYPTEWYCERCGAELSAL